MNSPGEPLTDEQIKELTSDLRQLQESLSAILEKGSESASIVELDQPIGRLTRMDAIQRQHMAKANRASHELRLNQVNAALRDLQKEDYGECKTCGEYIGFKRLKVRPEAPFCIECQSQREHHNR